MNNRVESTQPEITFTRDFIRTAFVERFPGTGISVAETEDPVSHNRAFDDLRSVLSLTGKIQEQAADFHEAFQVALPGFIRKEMLRIFQTERSFDKKAADAKKFSLTLSRYASSVQRLQASAGSKSHPSLNKFDYYRNYIEGGYQSQKELEPSLARNALLLTFKSEFRDSLSHLLNRLSDEAIQVVESAWSIGSADEKQLKSAGDVLHLAFQLNEEKARDILYSDADQRVNARELAIRQNLVLVKNDLLGYHGNHELQTAKDTAWHVNRILEEFEYILTDKELTEIRDYVSMFTRDLYSGAGDVLSADTQTILPSRIPALISLIEAEKTLHKVNAKLKDKSIITPDDEIMLGDHYAVLGGYYGSLSDHNRAIEEYKHALGMYNKSGKIPAVETVLRLQHMYNEKSEGARKNEQGYLMGLHIYNLLRPSSCYSFSEDDAFLLAAEITVIEKNLPQEVPEYPDQRLILEAAIVNLAEDPSSENADLLDNLLKQNHVPGEEDQRLHEIARFLTKGWHDRGAENTSAWYRSYFNESLRLESMQAVSELHQHFRQQGMLPEGLAIKSGSAAVRVIVREINGSEMEGRAAPLIVREESPLSREEAEIKLISGPVKLTEILTARGFGNPWEEIPRTQSVVYVPVVESPYGEQPEFFLQLTTEGPALTYVAEEGEIIGAFVTTKENPKINIHKLGENGGVFFWKPDPFSQMSPEKRKEKGSKIGTFELLTIPVVFDERREGGDGWEMRPVPPAGGMMLPRTNDFTEVRPGIDLAVLMAAYTQAMKKLRIEKANLVQKSEGDMPYYDSTQQFTDTLYSFNNLAGPDGSLKDYRAIPSSPSPDFELQQIGVEKGGRSDYRYGTFTGELRPDPNRKPSIISFGVMGVSGKNLKYLQNEHV